MFRYLAVSWDPAVCGATALARACVASIRSHPAWQQALDRPRLQVFLTGEITGVNQAYPLRGQRGVVLGRLFDRRLATSSPDRITRSLATFDAVADARAGDLLTRYWGRYVAFLEAPDDAWQVLRDPSGALPCFVRHHAGVSVAFSWLEDVLELLPLLPAPVVSAEGVAAFMAFGDLTGPRTALEGVAQVLAGQCSPMNGAAASAATLAWDAAGLADRPARLQPQEAVEALREGVQTCTRAWASCYDPVLLRLSGGLDSSILASCLAPERNASRVTCLNYHSAGIGSDERAFARMVATRFDLDLIEHERDSDFRLERILDVARTPVPTHYIGRTTSRSDAEHAQAVGASAMFTGGGGDQLFLEIRQWWPAADYLRVRGLDAGLPAATADAARLGNISVWKALRLALRDRFRRLPPPLGLHEHRALVTDLVRQRAARPAGFIHPVFIAPTPLPIGKLMQVQQLAYSAGYYDPYARQDAPELVRPLLSQPLIELCLRLPTFLLTLGGRGRGLARSAFAPLLPKPVVDRRTKGGMEEHIKSLLTSNAGLARQLLLDGALVRMDLLDRAAAEAALSRLAGLGAAEVGEIHFCLAIEAWLHSWTSSSQSQPGR